jgi:hypothetical protein
MKLSRYLLRFKASVLTYFIFTQDFFDLNTQANTRVNASIAFSTLSSTAIYNLIQGFKLQFKSKL